MATIYDISAHLTEIQHTGGYPAISSTLRLSALPFFPFVFVYVFRLLWFSSLAYPNLLGTKRLGCCCCNELVQ
jgi:hypothetical protein